MIRANRPVSDPEFEALRDFTRELVRTAGQARSGNGHAFLSASYTEAMALQITLASAAETLSNYSSHLLSEQVIDVHHWNDSLFGFKITSDRGLRFENGHFVMIGLHFNDKPPMRACTIASANSWAVGMA